MEEAAEGRPVQGSLHQASQQNSPSKYSAAARSRLVSVQVNKKTIHSNFSSTLFSNREPGKLFSESYQNVSVMFASLPNYIAFFSELDDKKPLNILHEIISKFDQVNFALPPLRV